MQKESLDAIFEYVSYGNDVVEIPNLANMEDDVWEAYFNAKKKLFYMSKYAVINIDDSYGRTLKQEIEIPFCTYLISDSNDDFYANEIICSNDGVQFLLHHNNIQSRVKFAIPGLYSLRQARLAQHCRSLPWRQ